MKKAYLLSALLILCVFAGCGKEDAKSNLKMKDTMLFEHAVSYYPGANSPSAADRIKDEEGYYVVSDMVYVTSDTLNLRKEPSVESELLTTVTYGTALSRTGEGEKGWDRILYEGQTAYVSQDYLITVPIQEEREFEFSQAMLSVVDTSRQIYSYDSLCEDLMQLKEAYGAHMQLNVLGTTRDNRNIFEVVVGNPNAKLQMTVVGTVCGTEYMTSLVCMKQLEYYLCFYETGNYRGLRYEDLFQQVSIRVIPMLNPDGATISQEYLSKISHKEIQDDLKRWFERDQSNGGTSLNLDNYLMFYFANGSGVDIRKNFAYRWEEAESVEEESSNGYKGGAAGSEPETKALVHLLSNEPQELVIAYHTTGSQVSWNFGQSETVLAKSKLYGEALSEFMNYEPHPDVVGKSAYGSFCGYAANVAGTPALQVQLGNGSAPLSLNEFNAIWNACRESWAAMQMELIIAQ